jgi:hypothetical protein
MLPPYNPILLFPCGHSLCKMCLFVNPHDRRDHFVLKLQKCPMCRQSITSHAVNISLMNLIMKYS